MCRDAAQFKEKEPLRWVDPDRLSHTICCAGWWTAIGNLRHYKKGSVRSSLKFKEDKFYTDAPNAVANPEYNNHRRCHFWGLRTKKITSKNFQSFQTLYTVERAAVNRTLCLQRWLSLRIKMLCSLHTQGCEPIATTRRYLLHLHPFRLFPRQESWPNRASIFDVQ